MVLVRTILITLCMVLTASALVYGIAWVREWHGIQVHSQIASHIQS
jgi:hypothetical protein